MCDHLRAGAWGRASVKNDDAFSDLNTVMADPRVCGGT
jgi:hypothetical protein